MDPPPNPLTPSDLDLPPPSSSLPPAMELPPEADYSAATAAWDWGSLLDFSLDGDDPLLLSSWDPPEEEEAAEPPPALSPEADEVTPGSAAKRVRKRDPRLLCPNFLAGRIPCSCPEVDQKAGEEDEAAVEAATGGKKRARTGGAAAAAGARCQVPECEADIRELKGYHRRHRVCLRCANAPSVLLDGEHKRYCQQCGKFHILSDFDEGKRSCRRKLERHNKRRRRRPIDSKGVVEKEIEAQGDIVTDVTCGEETGKELLDELACDPVEIVGSNKMDRETSLGSEDGQGSPDCSLPSFQDDQNNSVVSFATSVEAHIGGKLDNSKCTLSSKFSDNKAAYSSTCPTGRISFKLYDWNPAEFPRRLRHQIFQWLANMPVELEGYIRPGCTILTVFIAMPQSMWEKLYHDTASYVKSLINAPESLLRGKGIIFIYINNMIIQVLKDGTSLMNVKMEVQPPRLHYVHPTYFEAGQPMEFIACGSNLDQPKFRLLISFAGKYLKFESCSIISRGKSRSYNDNGGGSLLNSEHEIYKIKIAQTDPEDFGPAFVEVENICGISNFVPVLFGNKHICSELQRMENAFPSCECFSTKSILSQNVVAGAISSSCELFASKQTAMKELLLDIGWLLKKPRIDEKEFFSSINTQRLICLLKFLIHNKSASVLEVILHHLDSVIGVLGFDKSVNWTHDADLRLLQEYILHAREIICQRTAHNVRSKPDSRNPTHGAFIPQSFVKSDVIHSMTCSNQVKETKNQVGAAMTVASQGDDENVPLVTKESIQRCHPSNLHVKWGNVFPSNARRKRVALFAMASIIICFTVCIVLVHPREVSKFAVSVRRCLFGASMPWKI